MIEDFQCYCDLCNGVIDDCNGDDSPTPDDNPVYDGAADD